ncbi:MAG: hypothetical protein J0H64_04320 [Actinobacteria bacterium]|nr:hypothetical protein [Actinomycetota bacterium]
MSAHLTLVVDHRSASAAEPHQTKEPVETGEVPNADESSRSDAAHGVTELSLPAEPDDTSWVHAAWVPRPSVLASVIRRIEASARNGREALRGEESERGAVTAEYAIVILATVSR